MNTPAIRVLFLCTGNSCRSQMAEGLARATGEVESFSAGSDPQPVHPLAVRVLSEIDITGQVRREWSLHVAPVRDPSATSRHLAATRAPWVRGPRACPPAPRQ